MNSVIVTAVLAAKTFRSAYKGVCPSIYHNFTIKYLIVFYRRWSDRVLAKLLVT